MLEELVSEILVRKRFHSYYEKKSQKDKFPDFRKTKLKRLCLSQCFITNAVLSFLPLGSLEMLDLTANLVETSHSFVEGNQNDGEPDSGAAQTENKQNVPNVHEDVFTQISNLGSLVRFDCNDNNGLRIDARAWKHLVANSTLPSTLSVLSISNNERLSLRGIEHFTNLKCLVVSQNENMSTSDMKCINKLSANLRILTVSACGLNNAKLLEIGGCHELNKLDIALNPDVGDTTHENFDILKNFFRKINSKNKLKQLNISLTSLTTKFIKLLITEFDIAQLCCNFQSELASVGEKLLQFNDNFFQLKRLTRISEIESKILEFEKKISDNGLTSSSDEYFFKNYLQKLRSSKFPLPKVFPNEKLDLLVFTKEPDKFYEIFEKMFYFVYTPDLVTGNRILSCPFMLSIILHLEEEMLKTNNIPKNFSRIFEINCEILRIVHVNVYVLSICLSIICRLLILSLKGRKSGIRKIESRIDFTKLFVEIINMLKQYPSFYNIVEDRRKLWYRNCVILVFLGISNSMIITDYGNKQLFREYKVFESVFDITAQFKEDLVICEYACNCICNLVWREKGHVEQDLIFKSILLISELLMTHSTNDEFVINALDSLRNLTCDQRSMSPTIITPQILENIHSLLVASTNVGIKDNIYALIWNLSENNAFRQSLFETYFQTVNENVFSLGSSFTTQYYISMFLSNLLPYILSDKKFVGEVTMVEKVLSNIMSNSDVSVLPRSAWGEYLPLFALFQIENETVRSWGGYVLVQESFKENERERIIRESVECKFDVPKNLRDREMRKIFYENYGKDKTHLKLLLEYYKDDYEDVMTC